jgi:hypothetical protein
MLPYNKQSINTRRESSEARGDIREFWAVRETGAY